MERTITVIDKQNWKEIIISQGDYHRKLIIDKDTIIKGTEIQALKKNFEGIIKGKIKRELTNIKKGIKIKIEIEKVGGKIEKKENQLELKGGTGIAKKTKIPSGIIVKIEGQNKMEIEGKDIEKIKGWISRMKAEVEGVKIKDYWEKK